MQIVIDISEYNRGWIENAYNIPQDLGVAIAEAIVNGTVLPEGHGRLIDADELKDTYKYGETNTDDENDWITTVRRSINDAPTVIEAEEDWR